MGKVRAPDALSDAGRVVDADDTPEEVEDADYASGHGRSAWEEMEDAER